MGAQRTGGVYSNEGRRGAHVQVEEGQAAIYRHAGRKRKVWAWPLSVGVLAGHKDCGVGRRDCEGQVLVRYWGHRFAGR
jgi:hypothetical protein